MYIRHLSSMLHTLKIYTRNTRQVSSMIHSARPTVSPVANIVFSLEICFVLKMGTDGRTDKRTNERTNERYVQKQWSLPAVTVGRPRGSIFYEIHGCTKSNLIDTLVKCHRKIINHIVQLLPGFICLLTNYSSIKWKTIDMTLVKRN